MLTSRATATEIENLLEFLLNAEIALVINPTLDHSGTVTWPRRTGDRFLLGRRHFSVSDYRHWIRNGEYSALLYDGALLQVTYRFAGGRLVGHRLAYIPCPYNFAQHDLILDDIADLLALYDDCKPDDIILTSTIRFDYDPDNAQPSHPCSHMTVNTDICRIPCAAPMRLGHFVEFVFHHFYPHLWDAHPYFKRLSQEDWMAHTVTLDERRSLHVSWSRPPLMHTRSRVFQG